MPIDSSILRPALRCPIIAAFLVLIGSNGCGRTQGSEVFWWPEQILAPAERRQEIDEKTSRMVSMIHRHGLAGFLIRTPSGFGWLTGGCENPVPVLVDAAGKKFLLCAEPEGSRLLAEDLNGMGFEWKRVNRHERTGQQAEIARQPWIPPSELPFGSDAPGDRATLMQAEFQTLQASINSTEVKKYRWLGKAFAEAVESACKNIPRGMNERAIEAEVFTAVVRRAIVPVSIMVSSDARIVKFGVAPAGDDHKAEQAFLVRVCGRRWGLHVELTRMVSFGAADSRITLRAAAAAQVEARFWALTVPGAYSNTIAAQIESVYEGMIGRLMNCSPGGRIGYDPAELDKEFEGRGPDYRAGPDARVFCWRPCIDGFGMSDTVMLNGDSFEVLTRTADWPVLESRAGGRVYRTVGILVR